MQKEFSNATKYRWFEVYVEPLLTRLPKGESNLTILFDIAERAFRYQIRKQDLERVKAYLEVCEKIYNDPLYKAEVIELFTSILSEIEFEATSRLNEVILSTNDDYSIRHDLTMYTALSENFARPFLAPIFYYAHKYHQNGKGGPQSAQAYVNVSITEKEKAISAAIPNEKVFNLATLISGYDKKIRNAGTGHERWTVLDDKIIQFTLVSSSTGNVVEQFQLTEKDLSLKLKELEKLIWVLRAGLYIFLSNSDMKLPPVKPRTKAGVEKFSESFATGRKVTLETPFVWNEASSEIELTIRHTPEGRPTVTEIFMPHGNFEVIHVASKQPYKFQVLDVLKCVCLFIDTEKYKFVKVHTFFDDNKVASGKYNSSDLIKKIDAGDIPKPIEGTDMDPDLKINWVSDLTVPSGMREIMLPELKKMHPDKDIF